MSGGARALAVRKEEEGAYKSLAVPMEEREHEKNLGMAAMVQGAAAVGAGILVAGASYVYEQSQQQSQPPPKTTTTSTTTTTTK